MFRILSVFAYSIGLTLLLFTLSWGNAWGGNISLEGHGLGLRVPTPEEFKSIPNNQVLQVRPNSLAVERVREELSNRKLNLKDHALTSEIAVPVGPEEEVVYEALSRESAPSAKVQLGFNSVSSSPGAIPSSVDNTKLPAFPAVGNQGQENSCGSYSSTYYVLSHETCLARQCSNQSANSSTIFSPKWTYNFLNGGNPDIGSWPQDAYSLFISQGAPSLSQLPYSGSSSDAVTWDLNSSHWLGALYYRALSQQTFGNLNTVMGLNNLKQYLSNGHLVTFATDIGSWNTTKAGAGYSHAGETAVKSGSGANPTHAMTVVGYDDSVWVDTNGNGAVDSGEQGALRIVNQWGTGFGTGGFMWVPYSLLIGSQIFYANEGWALQVRSSYSPQLVAKVTLSGVTSRSSARISLGSSSAQTPSNWTSPFAFRGGGSALTFDGKSSNPPDGTFYFDLTDLIPSAAGSLNYFLRLSGQGSVTQVMLINPPSGQQTALSSGLPFALSGSSSNVALKFDTRMAPPVAQATANPPQADVFYPISFDGSNSTDPDGGGIVSYHWDFGDGTPALVGSKQVQHTYTSYGKYTATLTVTNNQNATQSVQISNIKVLDPTPPSAPSGLVIKVIN